MSLTDNNEDAAQFTINIIDSEKLDHNLGIYKDVYFMNGIT